MFGFPSLQIEEQEIAVIHPALRGIDLDLEKARAEGVRKTLVEVPERPVDRYAPSLPAGCSMRVALEDGESDAILTE